MKNTSVNELINELTNDDNIIKISNDYEIEYNCPTEFRFGCTKCRGIVTINRKNTHIDGNNKTIKIKIYGEMREEISVISIEEVAEKLSISNLNLEIEFHGIRTNRIVYAIKNQAKQVKIENCKITVNLYQQCNLTTIANIAQRNTTLESGADEFVLSGCSINVYSHLEDFSLPHNIYGVYNKFGNSITLCNNYIFINSDGVGERHKVIAVYNSGKYCRFSNNNIKANGSHNLGKLLEKCHVIGMMNYGDYLLVSDNNIVGEWGGNCYGIINYGWHIKIDGNKILSTHTMLGCSVVQYAEKGIINNNIITSTSRNPHLVEIYASNNIVSNNVIDALLRMECISGVGISVLGDESRQIKAVIICGNNIIGIKNIGIWGKDCKECIIVNNCVEENVGQDKYLSILLDTQENIFSNNITMHRSSNIDEREVIAIIDKRKIVSIYDKEKENKNGDTY